MTNHSTIKCCHQHEAQSASPSSLKQHSKCAVALMQGVSHLIKYLDHQHLRNRTLDNTAW